MLKKNVIDIGALLRRLRKDKGLTLLDLARETGVDRAHLSRLENNKAEYPPSEGLLVKVAKATDTDSHQLLFDNNKFPSEIVDLALNRKEIFDFLSIAFRMEKQLAASYWEKLTEELKELQKNSP